jgi:hypothetical protein
MALCDTKIAPHLQAIYTNQQRAILPTRYIRARSGHGLISRESSITPLSESSKCQIPPESAISTRNIHCKWSANTQTTHSIHLKMAPSVIPTSVLNGYGGRVQATSSASTTKSNILHRNIHATPPRVVSASGIYLTLSTGQVVLDASCGAAVSCLGHGHPRIKAAVMKQMDEVSYCHSLFYGTQAAEDLANELCKGTGGEMSRVFVVSSGMFTPYLYSVQEKGTSLKGGFL